MPCAPSKGPHSTFRPGIHAMCAVKRTTWHVSAEYSCHVRRQKDHMARFGQVFMPCVRPTGPHSAMELKDRAFSQVRAGQSQAKAKAQVIATLNLKRKMHGRDARALYKSLNIKIFRKTSAKKESRRTSYPLRHHLRRTGRCCHREGCRQTRNRRILLPPRSLHLPHPRAISPEPRHHPS